MRPGKTVHDAELAASEHVKDPRRLSDQQAGSPVAQGLASHSKGFGI